MADTKRATLFLLVGFPGAGKTTASQIIHELTGAVHIWADYERRAMFGEPSHSAVESRELYGHLNKSTALLLSDGQSVIFDTNFNFRKDRDKLRAIAEAHGADTKLVWVKVDKGIARKRALSKDHAVDNTYTEIMDPKAFTRMTGNLQPPNDDELPYILDGTLITPEYVAKELKLPKPSKQSEDARSLHATKPAEPARKIKPATSKHG